MIKQPSRYLLGLLLAILPAAAFSQSQPTLQPGMMVVARQDTLMTTKRDTVIVEKKDTVFVIKYDTMPAPRQQKADTVFLSSQTGAVTDSVIARAVRLGVMQALANQHSMLLDTAYERPAYLKTWDKMQERRKIKRVDRDMLRSVFIPKGEWLLGGTINYQEWDTENINILVLKNIDFEGHVFSATPYFGYFVANNLAIGGRYNYHREYFYLGKFDLNLGEDFNISLEDLYLLQHTHEASIFMRNYMSLGKSNIFGVFGEVRASYARSTGKNTTGSGTEYDGSYGHTNTISLSICPGMTVFATDFLAAEASIDIMGLKYRWRDQTTNRVENGSSRSGGANFKFSLLSINLGLTFYL